MAIAFDAASGAGANSTTLSHTVGTGANRYLVVACVGDIAADNLTGITYAGVAMVFVSKIQYPADRWIYQYVLKNPAVGANNIVASGLTFCNLSGTSYTGVKQNNTPDSSNTISAINAAPVLSTTVVASNCWLVGMEYGGSGKVAGTGTTFRNGAVNPTTMDSNGTVGIGTQSLNVTLGGGSSQHVGCILSLASDIGIARDVHGFVAAGVDTGKTLSLTLAAGSVLCAGLYSEAVPTSMSWNGTAMTQISQFHNTTFGYWMTTYFLGTPTSGTHNLVSVVPSSYSDLYGESFTNAATTTPTCTLSTAGSAWYFGVANGSALVGTVNAVQVDTSNATFQADFDSAGAATSNSMTVTRAPAGRLTVAAFAFKVAGGSTGNSNFFSFFDNA
jgi:hypothetical protein